VFDLSKLKKFKDKTYRDSYLQTQVRGGIAYQIRALRDKFGLSQTDFATKVGKKQSVISRLESTEYGRVSVQTLLDVACALDVALLVRFVSYPEFLDRGQSMAASDMQPDTIEETLITVDQYLQTDQPTLTATTPIPFLRPIRSPFSGSTSRHTNEPRPHIEIFAETA
jgi:transcriptional regulator with XRE-family HTH domain